MSAASRNKGTWPRCAAKTRKGTPCRADGAGIGGRCKFHGGLNYTAASGPPEPFLLFEVDGSRWLAVPEGLADAVPGKLTLANVRGCRYLRGRAWPQALGFRIVKRLSLAGRIARVEVKGQRRGRAWLTAKEFQARIGSTGEPQGLSASGDVLLMAGKHMYSAISEGPGIVSPLSISKTAAVALVASGRIRTGIVGAQVGEKILKRIRSAGVRVTRQGAQAPGAGRVRFEPVDKEPSK